MLLIIEIVDQKIMNSKLDLLLFNRNKLFQGDYMSFLNF